MPNSAAGKRQTFAHGARQGLRWQRGVCPAQTIGGESDLTLLKHQTNLMMALREVQNSANAILGEQGQALSGMVVAINELQGRVRDVDRRVLDLSGKFDAEITDVKSQLSGVDQETTGLKSRLEGVEGRLAGVEGRLEGVEGRLEGVEGRLEGVEGRLESVGQNVVAIMRHLGI